MGRLQSCRYGQYHVPDPAMYRCRRIERMQVVQRAFEPARIFEPEILHV
jgi:hypothetical protein